MEFNLGQCWRSDLETQLGLGIVEEIAHRTITIRFSEEKRIYSKENNPLRRFLLKEGDVAKSNTGASFIVKEIKDLNGLAIYLSDNEVLPESELSLELKAGSGSLFQSFSMGEIGSNKDFLLRCHAQKIKCKLMSSPAWGLFGCRLDLVQHQLYIANRALSKTELPRLMLSDEVGLGKTIEAGFIYHALRQRSRISRTLVLVPETLRHQWMVELYRRFNQMFSVMDEEAYSSVGIDAYAADAVEDEAKNDFSKNTSSMSKDLNPFAQNSEIICDFDFLLKNPQAMAACVATNWDLIIVDEAHHLHKGDTQSAIKYSFVEALAKKTPGILLLTATPHQLHPEYHFDRLRLLDPIRYNDFKNWESDQENYQILADVLSNLSDDDNISWEALYNAFDKANIHGRFKKAIEQASKTDIVASEWLRAAADVFGTGSSVFRNSRKRIGGFPTRILKEYPIQNKENKTKKSQDLKLLWLADFLKKHTNKKVLCLCSTKEKVLSLQKELPKLINPDLVVFHEEMTMIELDRAAAWFAEKDGARLLLASEIGSEGRNFQMAQDMVMFDLPEMPSLLEQRIGRLDRIGQRDSFTIHIPYIIGNLDEKLYKFFNQGLNVFMKPLAGADEIMLEVKDKLFFDLLKSDSKEFKLLLDKIINDARLLRELEENGRDRLLEFNSYNTKVSNQLITEIKSQSKDQELESFTMDVLEYYGVDTKQDVSANRWILKPSSQMKLDSFPGLLSDGISITSSRSNALSREDISFFSWEHPIAQGALDVVLDGTNSKATFACWEGAPLNKILCEYVFVLEYNSGSDLGEEWIWAPKMTRILLDNKGIDESRYLKALDKSIIIDGSFALLDEIISEIGYFEEGEIESLLIAKKQFANNIEEGLIGLQKVAKKENARLQCLKGLIDSEKMSELTQNLSKNLEKSIKKLNNPSIRLDAMRIILAD